jgi:hypothetical protein
MKKIAHEKMMKRKVLEFTCQRMRHREKMTRNSFQLTEVAVTVAAAAVAKSEKIVTINLGRSNFFIKRKAFSSNHVEKFN